MRLDEHTAACEAVRTGQPVVIRDPAEYRRRFPDNAQWKAASGAESMVSWPLTTGGKSIGVLVLMWGSPQPLDTAQLAYTSAVATMIGQALVRARVYADEHARAAVLQAAVLPTAPAVIPGLEVGVSYEPADDVQGLGGDWYDVMELRDGLTYLAIGDVVGHGLPAVEDMAQLRSAGRALALQGLSPARVLAELNAFTRHASNGKFATMNVAVFDPAHRSLSYASAGHPPPLLRRAATGEIHRLATGHGPVLGPLADVSYAQGYVKVEPGDILVMYTDGLIERRGQDIETGMTRAQFLIAQLVRRRVAARGVPGPDPHAGTGAPQRRRMRGRVAFRCLTALALLSCSDARAGRRCRHGRTLTGIAGLGAGRACGGRRGRGAPGGRHPLRLAP